MNNDKAFLRHEILNVITLVNFIIADSKLSDKEKAEILERLKLVTLLTSAGDVFLGKKKKFYKQKVELDDTLEIISLILEKRVKKAKISLKIDHTNLVLKTDRNVLKNGLEEILLNLMNISKKIHVKSTGRKLTMKYSGQKQLKLSKGDILQYLRNRHGYSEIFLQASIQLMKLNGIKTSLKKGLVEISLP